MTIWCHLPVAKQHITTAKHDRVMPQLSRSGDEREKERTQSHLQGHCPVAPVSPPLGPTY